MVITTMGAAAVFAAMLGNGSVIVQATPLPLERPVCALLDVATCDKLQPIPNTMADNLDTRLSGYGWPWVYTRPVDPDNPGWSRVEQLRWPQGW